MEQAQGLPKVHKTAQKRACLDPNRWGAVQRPRWDVERRARWFWMIAARARKASFACAGFGNAAATSGSNTITALPAAYRDAYLLREARLKSYSGRISPASACLVALPLVSDLFIVPSLTAGSPPRADYANRVATVNVHDRKQTPVLRKAQERVPLELQRQLSLYVRFARPAPQHGLAALLLFICADRRASAAGILSRFPAQR